MDNMRALTETETTDYLAGHKVFPGAVETEDGVFVPVEHTPMNKGFNRVAHTPGVRITFDCTCGVRNMTTHGKDADEAITRAEAICATHVPKENKMTMDEFMAKVLSTFPEAQVEQDNDGQLVIYTGLQSGDDKSVTPMQQCSANVGGDPVSGCDNMALPGSDYCLEHQE